MIIKENIANCLQHSSKMTLSQFTKINYGAIRLLAVQPVVSTARSETDFAL